jgi:hypothetical protein
MTLQEFSRSWKVRKCNRMSHEDLQCSRQLQEDVSIISMHAYRSRFRKGLVVFPFLVFTLRNTLQTCSFLLIPVLRLLEMIGHGHRIPLIPYHGNLEVIRQPKNHERQLSANNSRTIHHNKSFPFISPSCWISNLMGKMRNPSRHFKLDKFIVRDQRNKRRRKTYNLEITVDLIKL